MCQAVQEPTPLKYTMITFRNVLLLPLVVAACAGTENSSSGEGTAREVTGPDTVRPYADTAAIAARVDSIDRLVARHPDTLKLFAEIPGGAGLVPVKDSLAWPDEVAASYSIVFDSNAAPLLHRRMPTSESGDWFLAVTHYFDADGRTIFYDYSISSFASGCTEILRERIRTFVNPANGIPLARRRTFLDQDDRPVIDTANCYLRGHEAGGPKATASQLLLPR